MITTESLKKLLEFLKNTPSEEIVRRMDETPMSKATIDSYAELEQLIFEEKEMSTAHSYFNVETVENGFICHAYAHKDGETKTFVENSYESMKKRFEGWCESLQPLTKNTKIRAFSCPLRALKMGSFFEYDGTKYCKVSTDDSGTETCINVDDFSINFFKNSHLVMVERVDR